MTPKMIWGGLLAACLTTTAHASIEIGAADPITGQTWIRADSLAEGQALGYHAATSAEFVIYLSHGGFGNVPASQELFSRSVTAPLMGFKSDAYVEPAMIGQYGGPNVAMGWLDGTQEQMGAIMNAWGRQLSGGEHCLNGSTPNCYTVFAVNEAAYGTKHELAAGQHDRYAYGVGGDWAGALQILAPYPGSKDYQLPYFMVSGEPMVSVVPEPASIAFMTMGLALITGVVRKRKG